MEEYIFRGGENKSLEDIGIKAAALNHMKKLNLNVPEYVIISSKFSEKYFSSFKDKIDFILQEFSDVSEISKRILKLIEENEIQPFLIQELQKAIDILKKFNIDNVEGKLRLVLRNSKTYISGLDSRVFFNLQNVLDLEKNVRELFKDHFSEESINERKNKDLPLLHFNIPVILQKMIIPDYTGIIFPIPERKDYYYIVAWHGFGHDLNFLDADHYIVNHKDLLLEKLLNNKPGRIVFFDDTADSITVREVLHEEEFEPFLSQDQIIDLSEIYSLNKDNLGGLALEFKIKNNILYFISMKDNKIYHKAVEALKNLEEKAKLEEEKIKSYEEKKQELQQEKQQTTEQNMIETIEEKPLITETKEILEEPREELRVLEEQRESQTIGEQKERNYDVDDEFKTFILNKLENIERKLDFLLKKFE